MAILVWAKTRVAYADRFMLRLGILENRNMKRREKIFLWATGYSVFLTLTFTQFQRICVGFRYPAN